MTVLSAFMVQTIRATAGAHPSYPGINSRLAEKFNTTKTTIGRILSREQQPHVADDPSKALTLAELGMIC
jgi:hypothetical protein